MALRAPHLYRSLRGFALAAFRLAFADGVGADTFDTSLAALRPRGTLVLFGAASGKVPSFDPLRLMAGSYSLTRPTLAHFIAASEGGVADAVGG